MRTEECAPVEANLSPAQAALFRRMSRIDRRHCLDVFHTLTRARCHDSALLQAALLHDIGKAAGGLTLLHRVAVVLMRRFMPRLLDRLAEKEGGWRNGFWVHVCHPQIGARWAEQAASSPQVVFLIREHHNEYLIDDRLALLRRADGQN